MFDLWLCFADHDGGTIGGRFGGDGAVLVSISHVFDRIPSTDLSQRSIHPLDPLLHNAPTPHTPNNTSCFMLHVFMLSTRLAQKKKNFGLWLKHMFAKIVKL